MLQRFESVGRAIADRNRLRILKMLEPGELCVCQITAVLSFAPATVSKHLSLLKTAGLVVPRKEGRWVFYRLAAHGGHPLGSAALHLVRTELIDDPVIAEDRQRLAHVNAVPIAELLSCGARILPA